MKCIDVDSYNEWKYDSDSSSGYSQEYEEWLDNQRNEENWD
jgi:hypothetical protein